MPGRRDHSQISKQVLGQFSLGESFQVVLDGHSKVYGPYHRQIDHTWERVSRLSRLYGEVGRAEILIHLALDYGLMPTWEKWLKRDKTHKGK